MALPSRAIKDGLIAILQAIQYQGEPAFTEVRGHPRGEFDSYPSVSVLPGDQATEKVAYGQNDRTPSYIIRTQLKATNDGTEFDYMYELTDLIIDALDSADFDGVLSAAPDVPPVNILNASRADWFEGDSQAGPLLICDVDVSVEYSKDN